MDMPRVNPQDRPRTLYQASEGKCSQQPTVPYHPKLTSSSVHHLSDQWSVLFFIALQYRIINHLCQKRDVKQ